MPINVTRHTLLIALALIVLLPIAYTARVSLRPQGYGLASEARPNDDLYFGHYQRLFNTPRFGRSLINSAVNSIGGAALTTVTASAAGYAFARLRFPGRQPLLLFLLLTMLLPGITNLIPLFKIASDLGLLSTYLLLIVVYGAYGVPFGVWVMKAFYESIPPDLEEAAAVDGATVLQTLWYVLVPLAMPGIAAVFLLNIVFNWNDFLTAQMLIQRTAMKTAVVTLFDFQSQLDGNNSELLAAAAILIMLPGLLIFLIARRMFLRAVLGGSR